MNWAFKGGDYLKSFSICKVIQLWNRYPSHLLCWMWRKQIMLGGWHEKLLVSHYDTSRGVEYNTLSNPAVIEKCSWDPQTYVTPQFSTPSHGGQSKQNKKRRGCSIVTNHRKDIWSTTSALPFTHNNWVVVLNRTTTGIIIIIIALWHSI